MSERMIINSVYGIGIGIKKHCLRLYVVKNISLKTWKGLNAVNIFLLKNVYNINAINII